MRWRSPASRTDNDEPREPAFAAAHGLAGADRRFLHKESRVTRAQVWSAVEAGGVVAARRTTNDGRPRTNDQRPMMDDESTFHASRFKHHVSRLTFHVPRTHRSVASAHVGIGR